MEDNTRNMKTVWSMAERGQPNGVTKTYWTRVGVGFVNRDGSITLRLDAIPLSGNLQIREWEPHDRRSDTAESPSAARRGGDYADGASRPQRPKSQPGPGESLV